MTNFERWRTTVDPKDIADLFGNCDGDACVNCPASGVCNIDDYDEMEDPTIVDACRGEFLKWANQEESDDKS